MTNPKYKMAYQAQRHNAKRRGIEFRLTFEEWVEWWGDDIDRRGRGETNLQMQRIADAGAYELGNIKKGVPLQNSKTAQIVRRNRELEVAAERRVEQSARLMSEDAGEKMRDRFDEDERELHRMFYFKSTQHIFG